MMPAAGVRRGSAIFRPRARILRTIGRDLITNEIIALQELIKNAYDADARKVIIQFEEPLLQGQGAIEVSDDGDGMTLKTIKTAWMEPATVSKVQKKTSRTGRRVTGEKGIGRFAAARVASALEVKSVARGSRKEIRVRFDWGVFDDHSRYLDQIRCNWEERNVEPTTKPGTTLRLIGLNDEWKEDKEKESFSSLRAELSRLVSPLNAPDKFAIELILPERFREFAGLIAPPAILGKPHYKLTGHVDAMGTVQSSYFGPGESGPLLEGDGNQEPRIIIPGGRRPRCGPFAFEFRVWDRAREDLDPLAKEFGTTLRDLKRDLDAACGISIYRDRFRVLLPENDWLRLDLRRVQNPTMRISNNQIVGMVSISADKNKGLRDQTNRQGIVDSPQFDDFKAALKDLLSRLEVKRDSARRAKRPQSVGKDIFQQLDFSPIRTFIEQRYPQDQDLKHFLEQTAQSFQHGIAEVQEVVSRYRRLATLGQLMDVILHEGRAPISSIQNEVDLTKKDLGKPGRGQAIDKLPRRLDSIEKQLDLLSGLFRRIAPFSGRKRGRPSVTTVEKVISATFALAEKQIRDLNVKVSIPDTRTPITADEAEMQMIFWNLLDNALYWLEKVPEDQRQITVQVMMISGTLNIVFSDSGPGVPEEFQDRIFDPYFSSKPDGVGLGLTIAGETASEYDGSLELLGSGPQSGATFRVVLRRRIGFDNA